MKNALVTFDQYAVPDVTDSNLRFLVLDGSDTKLVAGGNSNTICMSDAGCGIEVPVVPWTNGICTPVGVVLGDTNVVCVGRVGEINGP